MIIAHIARRTLVQGCGLISRGTVCIDESWTLSHALVPSRLPADSRFSKAFDPAAESYGHGNSKTENTTKSILHPDLKTIPRVPQVQLIGNGTVYDHQGLAEVRCLSLR